MNKGYDKYYRTENLFGEAYPELINFYKKFKVKGKLLDIGCGQGRDAIPLARMGFDVTGLDNSKVGIDQLNEVAKRENLMLQGFCIDIYEYHSFEQFDFILLDSMFHFTKKDTQKELMFLNNVISKSKSKAVITICIQDSGKKLATLNASLSLRSDIENISRTNLIYHFEDKSTNHKVETEYAMISFEKNRIQ